MTRIVPFSFRSVVIALITVAVIVFGVINFIKRAESNAWIAPDDGVSWRDSEKGVEAWIVEPAGPGDKAGSTWAGLNEAATQLAIWERRGTTSPCPPG